MWFSKREKKGYDTLDVLFFKMCFYCQGWTKFYEFSLSDLRAGFEIIDRLFEGKRAWNYAPVHSITVGNSLHL